jgi:hypothetical protein
LQLGNLEISKFATGVFVNMTSVTAMWVPKMPQHMLYIHPVTLPSTQMTNCTYMLYTSLPCREREREIIFFITLKNKGCHL